MSWLLDLWHNVTPAQGTILGGTTVLIAGIIAFGTGSLNRRSEAKRFHYEEMKTLYAQALRIARDLDLLKAVPPEDREKTLGEKVDAMQTPPSRPPRTASAPCSAAESRRLSRREWWAHVLTDSHSGTDLKLAQPGECRDYGSCRDSFLAGIHGEGSHHGLEHQGNLHRDVLVRLFLSMQLQSRQRR
jgi:hypothetical protein